MFSFLFNLIFLFAFIGSIGLVDSNFLRLASNTGSLIISSISFSVIVDSKFSSFCFAFTRFVSGDILFLIIGDKFFVYDGLHVPSGEIDRGPCFRDNSLGDHLGDLFRLGDIRGEFLGDDHGDLRGDNFGDLDRGDILRGDIFGDIIRDNPLRGDNPGDFDLGDNLRIGDIRLGDNLGDLDLNGDLD